jgi:hypothetical protein
MAIPTNDKAAVAKTGKLITFRQTYYYEKYLSTKIIFVFIIFLQVFISVFKVKVFRQK